MPEINGLYEGIERQDKEAEAKEKAALIEAVITGEEYIKMKKDPGWQRLEKLILERTNSLSRKLLLVESEKDLFRCQGELLGIQSVVNIVESAIEDMQNAQEELKGEIKNG